MGQFNPKFGYIMGFWKPRIGLGSIFPVWEMPFKTLTKPINSPFFPQFGNCEKFPVYR